MDIFAKILSSLLISVTVGVAIALLRVRGNAPCGLVRYGKFFGIISAVLLAAMVAIAMLCAFGGKRWDISLLFLGISAVPLGLLLSYFNFRIRYDEQGFEIRGMLGVTRKYTYDQITGIRQGTQDATLHMGKRRVCVDIYMLGSEEFIAYAQKQYKKQTKGERIPPAKPRIDPFGGHVREPELYVVLMVALQAVGIGIFLFSIFYTLLPPTNPEKATEAELCFVSCQTEDKDLCLYTEDGALYKIQDVGDRFDTQRIREICDARTPVTVLYKYVNVSEKDGGPYCDVLTVSDGQDEIFGFAQYVALHRRANLISIPITLGLLLFCTFGAVGTLVVGRNPSRYKKWIVHLFFGKNHIES